MMKNSRYIYLIGSLSVTEATMYNLNDERMVSKISVMKKKNAIVNGILRTTTITDQCFLACS